jgi:two-component system secretion system sensor histidine kinase SalK
MRHQVFVRLAKIVFVLFIFFTVTFLLFTKSHNYLGIRAKKIGNEWVIKKIHSGGAASYSSLQVGDHIVMIDNVSPEESPALTKWLIVDGVESIKISREGESQVITFSKQQTFFFKQVVFTFLAFICLNILFILPTLLTTSKIYRMFFLFVVLLAFSLISVIPSSLGNNVARGMIILVVSFFPYFLLKFSDYGKNNVFKNNLFTKIVSLIGLVNIVLLLVNLVGIRNYWLSEYLALGIFYIFGLILLVFVLANLVLPNNFPSNNTQSQVNLSLITVLSFVPLFFFYFLPYNNAPFYLVVLFILFPLVAIIHLLVINRLIKHRKKINIARLTFFMTLASGGIIWLLLELGSYIPTIYLAIYTVILLYALFPLISELLLLISQPKEGTNGIQTFIAVEEERENIAMYIHDTIIQEVILEMSQLDETDTIRTKTVQSIFEEIIYELRELCTEIYPLMIQELGFENTLRTTLNFIQQKYPVTIIMEINYDVELFPLPIKNFLLRTIRECVNNSIKHGLATVIEIQMSFADNTFLLTVWDDGELKTQEKTFENHFGLKSINEKVKMLNGKTTLTRELSRTKFQLELPREAE